MKRTHCRDQLLSRSCGLELCPRSLCLPSLWLRDPQDPSSAFKAFGAALGSSLGTQGRDCWVLQQHCQCLTDDIKPIWSIPIAGLKPFGGVPQGAIHGSSRSFRELGQVRVAAPCWYVQPVPQRLRLAASVLFPGCLPACTTVSACRRSVAAANDGDHAAPQNVQSYRLMTVCPRLMPPTTVRQLAVGIHHSNSPAPCPLPPALSCVAVHKCSAVTDPLRGSMQAPALLWASTSARCLDALKCHAATSLLMACRALPRRQPVLGPHSEVGNQHRQHC